MANVVDGHIINPSSSPVLTGEEVANIFQIYGLVSPGLRNVQLEKTCLLVEGRE